jgi:hypothetical protein
VAYPPLQYCEFGQPTDSHINRSGRWYRYYSTGTYVGGPACNRVGSLHLCSYFFFYARLIPFPGFRPSSQYCIRGNPNSNREGLYGKYTAALSARVTAYILSQHLINSLVIDYLSMLYSAEVRTLHQQSVKVNKAFKSLLLFTGTPELSLQQSCIRPPSSSCKIVVVWSYLVPGRQK